MSSHPHCVVDTQVVGYANSPVTSHVSPSQRSRWTLLRHICGGRVKALISPKLRHEYEQRFRNEKKSEIVQEFIKTVDEHGVRNYAAFAHHHVARSDECRFPQHDRHLLRTAHGVDGSVIAAEEDALLQTADCIRHAFDIRILTPGGTIAHWGLKP